MTNLWHWMFGKPCEHDWQEKATLTHFYEYEGRKIQNGLTFVKECSKCHRVWSQRVP